ncbi:hypothetical protein EMIHUDRAFT_221552 [Emiliania huxleyi CCMP1516]|uniref:EamA domain-containing protein n=2 Tax=Emiliania huxleyi TaxID=2903 RepID=A0A0D3HYM1_EMIH1|nr:hypothetical protein EMIHUDRAFT_221552 [Emiliania huxleyi CCMP1516]EOD04106.1 hypothetical protein EMIHUDRAFT_221552 [Emiliania huxleyi CCMP1516]|eukprot:XP_005756535.1 hypothetical protein EMIHUDRAFT_221552 [Emiliania huxleyi CCMP1516]
MGWPWLLARGVTSLGVFGLFWAYSRDELALGDVAALYQTIPLWTILFSYLYLKEKPNAAQGVAATLALTGAMLIARPTFVRQAIGAAALYLTMGLGTCFSIAVAASVGAFDVPPEKGLAAWLSSVGVASVAGAGLICVGVLILTLSPRVEQSTNGVGVHEGDQPAGGGAPSHGSDKLLPPGVPRS